MKNSGWVRLGQIVRRRGLLAFGFVAALAVFQSNAGLTASPGAQANDDAIAEISYSDPAQFLEEFSHQALQMLSDGTLTAEQRRAELRRFFRLGFDLESISRFVLGRHWRASSPDEREEFMGLFEAFVVGFYADKFDRYSGETLQMGSSRALDGETMSVASHVLRPGAASVKVDWRLRKSGEAWRIVDVVVEGVSLAIVQRSEFDSVIRNNGGRVEGLLAVLRQRTQN